VRGREAIEDFAVAEAMLTYGGSFVRALGELCHKADPYNLARLKAAFPEYWVEYTELVLLVQSREAERAR
jgi:hypothetical protein